jgi:alpha-L-fucosidase
MPPTSSWFTAARFGLFVHYGLYSLLERGEWVMNREQIPRQEYSALAGRFTAERFDADAICDLALRAGMRYLIFTTMHHDGFRLYDTKLSNFNSVQACGRDLTREIVEAARKRNLKIALYHSLNNWMDEPDAVAALEDKAAYEIFINNTFARIRELVENYNPVDVLWYDGWWPFNAESWQAEKLNAMVRELQPQILFNGRNGLAGDFATPENHVTAPCPWRPWEACMTLNSNWGYHAGDENWKTPKQIVDMMATSAQGRGNLVLNVAPRGNGEMPEASVQIIETVGAWLQRNGECFYDTDSFSFNLRERGEPCKYRGEWGHFGPFTARENCFYLLARCWPGERLTIGGLQCAVKRVTILGWQDEYSFEQQGERVTVSGLPSESPDAVCPVIRFECDRPPAMYLCGGLSTPRALHPHYDPCPSDIAH